MEENIIKNHSTTYVHIKKSTLLKQKYLSRRFVVRILGNIFTYVLVLGIAFVIIYPLIRRLGNAFKPTEDFYDTSIVYFPKNPTLDVIKEAIAMMDFKKTALFSFALAFCVGVIQMAVTTLIAYGFARFNFRGSRVLFFCVVMTLVIPPQTIIIPLYLRFRNFDIFGIIQAIKGTKLNLINTFWCQAILALTGLGWKNGLYIYMMRSYFRGFPKQLEEAAYIDGAKIFKAFVKIMLPSALPMMLTVFLFSFSWQWTDTFYTGMFFTDKVSFILTSKIDSYSYNVNKVMELNIINTATLIVILPLIVLFIATQRFFVEGIERSGLTG